MAAVEKPVIASVDSRRRAIFGCCTLEVPKVFEELDTEGVSGTVKIAWAI